MASVPLTLRYTAPSPAHPFRVFNPNHIHSPPPEWFLIEYIEPPNRHAALSCGQQTPAQINCLPRLFIP